MSNMKKMVFRVALENEKSKRRAMRAVAGVGVESVAVDLREGIMTVIGDADPVFLAKKIRKLGFFAELLSVGPAKEEKKEAEKKMESKRDIANKGIANKGGNYYLGMQKMEAAAGFRGMNWAIEDARSKERIIETVAGFGDFTSIYVDVQRGMVTVVGKSVPVCIALKIRELGYRAKLVSVGSA
uniref:HMA domain-containing protein n=1 Tax=Picea sitchensis TaxID=3332 RepID=A9NQW2_PICSI|nr:unknown [Picea sitchensis]